MYKIAFNECTNDVEKVYVVNDLLRRHNDTGYMTHEQLVYVCQTMLGELLERNALDVETCILNSNSGTRQLKCFEPRKEDKYYPTLSDKYLEILGKIEDVDKRAEEFNLMLEDLRISGEFISQYDILEFWHFVLKTFEGTEYKIQFNEDGKIIGVNRQIETFKFE